MPKKSISVVLIAMAPSSRYVHDSTCINMQIAGLREFLAAATLFQPAETKALTLMDTCVQATGKVSATVQGKGKQCTFEVSRVARSSKSAAGSSV